MGTVAPRLRDPSAVMRTFAPASARRAATASGPKPLKIGTQIAPIFEHAMTAATVSIAIGMKIPTAFRCPTPIERRPCASRSVSSRSSRYVTRRTSPSSPSHTTAIDSGVLSAQTSTH